MGIAYFQLMHVIYVGLSCCLLFVVCVNVSMHLTQLIINVTVSIPFFFILLKNIQCLDLLITELAQFLTEKKPSYVYLSQCAVFSIVHINLRVFVISKASKICKVINRSAAKALMQRIQL